MITITQINYTGDCSNTSSGGFEVNFLTTVPDVLVTWISPTGFVGSNVLPGYAQNYVVSGLSAGTYQFIMSNPSVGGIDPPLSLAFYIISGYCISIDAEPTTCGVNNGTISGTSTLNDFGNGLSQAITLYDVSGDTVAGSTTTNNGQFSFGSLQPGMYYVTSETIYGCSARSQTCVIRDSNPLNFDFLIINNSSCANNIGKVFVDNITGSTPFTYLWGNGETTSYITGLTTGSYSVTVTDSNGCSISKAAFVGETDPLGVSYIDVIQPSCFGADGEVTIYVTGGTPPFIYSGSNLFSDISFVNSYTFTGISSGNFNFSVIDAGLCQYVGYTVLAPPSSFSISSVVSTDSTCNTNGTLTISVIGAGLPYSYRLFDSNSNLINSFIAFNSQTCTFNSISSGTYTYEVTDANNICTFSDTVTINNITSFDTNIIVSGTSCNLNNGSIEIQIIPTGSSSIYEYSLDGPTSYPTLLLPTTAWTFTNLQSGFYTIKIKDTVSSCLTENTVYIEPSTNVNFSLYPLSYPGNHSLTALITEGEPPFTLIWDPVVNGQTGATITGLTTGTYKLTVIDSNGCNKTSSKDFQVISSYSSSGSLTMCNNTFGATTYGKRGILQMFIDGFIKLTPGGVGCIISAASFTSEITISGNTYIDNFFTTSNFDNIPTDNQFAESLEDQLESIYGIGDVTIDLINNVITIRSDCELPENLLSLATVTIKLKIDYLIACITSDLCCGIITEDFNVNPEGPNFCIITEDFNIGAAGPNFVIIIEQN